MATVLNRPLAYPSLSESCVKQTNSCIQNDKILLLNTRFTATQMDAISRKSFINQRFRSESSPKFQYRQPNVQHKWKLLIKGATYYATPSLSLTSSYPTYNVSCDYQPLNQKVSLIFTVSISLRSSFSSIQTEIISIYAKNPIFSIAKHRITTLRMTSIIE